VHLVGFYYKKKIFNSTSINNYRHLTDNTWRL